MGIVIKKGNKPLLGELRPDSDKSISQRMILFSLLTQEECVIKNISLALDPKSALQAASLLGLNYRLSGDTLITKGPGFRGLKEPKSPLFCGNSGTLMRFLMGLLAPSDIFSVLTGDDSLNSRPMERIATPLRQMGAFILTRKKGLAPLAIEGRGLKGIDYTLPVPSAQLKSAVILAALHSQSPSVITEIFLSRDHTERLLQAMGAQITPKPGFKLEIVPSGDLEGIEIYVGGDFSAAAFIIAAGLLDPRSEIILQNVNLNPSRTGMLDVLQKMGADITVQKEQGIEPKGTLFIRGGKTLKGTTVEESEIPKLIDEIPILAVIAANAEGPTTFKGVKELTVKESNRLEGITDLLGVLGRECFVKEKDDLLTLTISGNPGNFAGGKYHSRNDHRLAMSAAIAGTNSQEGILIQNPECVKISQPAFYTQLRKLGVEIL